MKNYIIEEKKRDYTKGLTELEFSVMRGEIAQQMYSGINDIDCDDCQSAEDMHWIIQDIYSEETDDDTYYTVAGIVYHSGTESKETNDMCCDFWVIFTATDGIVSTMVCPSEE